MFIKGVNNTTYNLTIHIAYGKQFNGVFRGKIAADTPLTPQPEEVSDTRWVTVKELKKQIAEQPDNFTPGVRRVVERYY